MLNKRADVNASRDESGRSIFHWVADMGDEGLVRLLMSEGATIDAIDNNGNTPLHLAAQNGHFNVVCCLVGGESCEAAAKQNKVGKTPMHLAAENGHFDVVQCLGAVRPDAVDAKDIDGNTSMHLAAQNGHLSVVQYLVEKGHTDLTAKSRGGKTPRDLAARKDMIDYL